MPRTAQNTIIIAFLAVGLACQTVIANKAGEQDDSLPPSKIDMQGFLKDTLEAANYRQNRLLSLDDFLEMAKAGDTVLLDTRSAAAYGRKHLAGAVHLNFSDFTAEKLATIIPSSTTRVLIYCNNNIAGDNRHFASKKAPLALNIPTFVNLYGYGYRNIYELAPLVSVNDPRLVFEGSAVNIGDSQLFERLH